MRQRSCISLLKNYTFDFVRKSLVLLATLTITMLSAPTLWAESKSNMNVEEQQQTGKITGNVVDDKDEPAIGVAITVKGKTTGTVTDIDGNYSIEAGPDDILQVSYVGYNPQSISVKDKKTINIKLELDSKSLQEVVVEVGYRNVKRANMLGAVAALPAQEIQDITVTNLSQALEGRMPGVTVGSASGSPLATPSLKVRTSGTWNMEEPIYVIDGFIRNKDAFDVLDASEVESISILKDAAAAVYGVRGAGGVVLVKTKTGKEGKLKVSYSGSVGFSNATHIPDVMSAYEQATVMNNVVNAKYNWDAAAIREATIGGGDPNITWFSDEEREAFKNINHDWMDGAWKTAMQTRHNLNFSGGNEQVRYFVGGSYTYQDGNFDNLDMHKYSARIGLEFNVTKDLLAKATITTSNNTDSRPFNSADGSEYDKMYFTYATLLRQPRWKPAYIDGLPVGNDVSNHPLVVIDSNSRAERKSDNTTMMLDLGYDLPWVQGLKASAIFNYSKSSGYSKTISQPYTLYNFVTYGGGVQNGHLLSNVLQPDNPRKDITNNERIQEAASSSHNYQLNARLDYARIFGKHDVSAMVNFEQSQSWGNDLSFTLANMLIQNVETVKGYGRDGVAPTITDGITKSGRQAFIGQFNYSFDGKYLLETAFRYEASTRFAPGERWGFFPSVAVGWRISEEDFFKDHVNTDVMDNLKFRASYGRLGSDHANALSWEDYYDIVTGTTYLGGASSYATGLRPGNGGVSLLGITWEKTDSYNVGFDLNAFRNFSFSIDGFYKYTFDILQKRTSSLPYQSGLPTDIPAENYGKQRAYGGEINIVYSNKIGQDFKYSVGGNLSYATSRVVQKYTSPAVTGTWEDEVGRIRGGETGYFSEGIIRTEEQLQAYIDKYQKYDQNGNPIPFTVFGLAPSLGMIALSDVGGAGRSDEPDGVIDDNDIRIISKYDTPPFHYGFSLSGQWKGIKVDMTFSGQFGNDVLYDKAVYGSGEGNRNSMEWLSTSSNNLTMWTDSWSPDNPGASMPKLYNGNGNVRSTFWMVDGHTLSLRNINVSYTIPQSISAKMGLASARVFFSGNNIWTVINPYSYKDPNLSSWMDYPLMRSFNFGLNINI